MAVDWAEFFSVVFFCCCASVVLFSVVNYLPVLHNTINWLLTWFENMGGGNSKKKKNQVSFGALFRKIVLRKKFISFLLALRSRLNRAGTVHITGPDASKGI